MTRAHVGRQLEDADEVRRHHAAGRDALGGDQPQALNGVEARHDHDRRADEEMLGGVGVRHRVIHRARDQVDVRRPEAPQLHESLLRFESQLGIERLVHDALRATGGAGGVDEAVEAARRRTRRRRIGRVLDRVLERRQIARRADDQTVLRRRPSRRGARRRRFLDERLVEHEHVGGRVLEDVGDLAAPPAPVDGDGERPQLRGGVRHGEELGMFGRRSATRPPDRVREPRARRRRDSPSDRARRR